MRRTHKVGLGVFALLVAPVVRGGELRVCTDSVAPFLSIADGKAVGIEYDILALFATQQTLSMTLLPVEQFAELIPALQTNRCDVAAAIMTRTPERAQLVDFSASYFPVRMVLMQLRGGPVGKDLATLRGKRVGTIKGTMYEERLKRIKGLKLLYGSTYEEIARMTVDRQTDAFACDTTLAVAQLKRFPTLEIVQVVSELEYYAFALRRGSPLVPKLDQMLAAIKRDGRYRTILEKHLDPETVELVLSLQ